MRVLKRKQKKKPSNCAWPYTIYVDDREKKGIWHIDHMQFKFVKKRLAVADYTIKGYEDIIAVEKKSGFKEFIGNLTGAKRPKFEKYLEKLSEYELGVIVIEGNYSSLQRVFRELKFSKMTPEGVFHWTHKILAEYGIPVITMDCKEHNKDLFLYALFDQLLQEAERIRNGR